MYMKWNNQNNIEKIFQSVFNEIESLQDVFYNDVDSKVRINGPYYYGYSMTMGPNGKPMIKEFGNLQDSEEAYVKTNSEYIDPQIDIINDENNNKIKIIAEMPGVKKENIEITENQGIIKIKAENGERKYNKEISTGKKLNANKTTSKFINGILELEIELEKPETEKKIKIS